MRSSFGVLVSSDYEKHDAAVRRTGTLTCLIIDCYSTDGLSGCYTVTRSIRFVIRLQRMQIVPHEAPG